MRKKLLKVCMMALFGAVSTAAYALDKVDGVYQIGSVEDFKDFAALVNDEGDTYACAVLTADIDMGTDGTMIGCDANRFRGIFDGKGHTITVNSFPKVDGQAIFRNIEGNALIQNLKVQGTITTGKKEAAGIVGWGRGTIRNCWVDLTVESSVLGDGTHAGIIGVADEGLVVENCLAQITVNGPGTENCGGIAGWANAAFSVANCLVINDGTLKLPSDCGTISRNPGNLRYVDVKEYNGVGKEDFEVGYGWRPRGASYNNFATKLWKQSDVCTIDPEGVKNGRVCYQLNHDQSTIAWVQNIGEDEFPVPAVFGKGKKQVYASAATDCSGKAEGELTYSNSGTAQAAKHTTDKFGVCTVCGHMEFEKLERDMTDNSYIAKTAEDLDWLEGRNRTGNGGWFNISLGNDIEYIAEPGKMIFNNDNWFGGNIDGHGHTLTFEFVDIEGEHTALIPHMRGSVKNLVINGTVNSFKNNAGLLIGTSEGDTRIENVEVHGYLESSGQYAGTVVGRLGNGGVKMTNVYSDADFHASRTGDNTSGGIVGLPDKDWYATNVIYAGNITAIDGAECIGSFAGWSNGNGHLTNVAFLGSMEGMTGDSHAISRNPGKVNLYTKFYYVNDFPEGVKIADNEAAAMEQVSAEDVKSGKLAFMLNGNVQGGENFYQVIGKDATPKPFAKEGAKVYAIADSYLCDGTPMGSVAYKNSEAGAVIPPHKHVDGFCSVCGDVQDDYITPTEDGWYEVGTPEQLRWWSHYAAKKNLGANLRLTADIDMSSVNDYALIGTEAAPFYGSVDGQFHTISNLEIKYPGNRGVGLIGVMNSRASKTDGISDADARAAEGTFIKDIVMDETCTITGGGYAGLVGMTAEWAGHVTFQNVGLDCDVTCTTGANAGGVLGCVMGSTCHITIDNCYMTGNVHGIKEDGAFSGWLGSYCEIKNCYAIGAVDQPEGTDTHKYFARYSSAKITNCYTLNGGTVNDADHFVGKIDAADIETGKLCYLLNGNQFRSSFYYQTIGEDVHPVANPAHGTVVFAADQYMTVTDETIDDVCDDIRSFYEEKINDAHAYTGAVEAMSEDVGSLDAVADLNDLADALDSIYVREAAVNASIRIYAAYDAKVKETVAYLEEHKDFKGDDRDALEAYLSDEAPSIYEDCELADSLIEKEIAKIDEMLAIAIENGYIAGTDITKMLVNADFSQGKDAGWTGTAMATGHGVFEREDGTKLYGIESWSSNPFAISQTVKNLKPGYYLVEVDGAYRPQNDRYSYNYAAYFSANGVTNYLQTVIEDPVSAGEAIDGVNCHTTGATVDLGISEDGMSTSFDEDNPADAYVVHGPHGLAIAASAGRYKNFVACKVGAEGELTISIANPHSKVGTNEWTGASDVYLTYLGTDDELEMLDNALESQLARANSILNNYMVASADEAVIAPNYPAALQDALIDAVAAAEAAGSAEEKMAAIETLSQLFQDIYAGKQAYVHLAGLGVAIENVLTVLGDNITEEEYAAIFDDVLGDIYDQYEMASLSTEEALNYDLSKVPALTKIVAPQDEKGTYQISEPLQLIYFGSVVANNQKANAVLTKDIDMTGIYFEPLGNGARYKGTFDGQNFAIKNLVMGDAELMDAPKSAALFMYIENATIKNVKIQSTINTSDQFAAGIVSKSYGDSNKIQYCEVDLTVNSAVVGDGTHGGIISVNEESGTLIEYCKVRFTLNGESTSCWGGVIGWSTNASTVKHTLVMADVVAANLDGSNSISRNDGNCTVSDTYFTTKLNGAGIGSYVDPESGQLESGELTYKLNGSKSSNTSTWRQTLGKHNEPMLLTGKVVYKSGSEFSNEKQVDYLNAFAYNVQAGTTKDEVSVAYTLNAPAKTVNINFYDGDKKVATVAGDATAGNNVVTVLNSELGVPAGTSLTYEVEVDGIGAKQAFRAAKLAAWSPYGLAVNNTPASAGFGNIYVVESDPATPGVDGYVGGSQPYISDKKHSALYAFTPDFEPILAEDGEQGFTGGLDIKPGLSVIANYDKDDLKTVRVSKDGRVFISRTGGIDASPLYEVNPADLNAPWSPVFTGGQLDAETGITYVEGEEQSRMISSFGVEGEGADLKLWTLGGAYSNGGYNYSDYACYTYDLGTAAHWTTTPSSTVDALTGVYTIAPKTVSIMPDQRGGVWYVQYRANPNEKEPSIKHVNAEGVVDYTDETTVCAGAGLAVSPDGSRIAVITNTTGKIGVYDVNFIPNAIGEISINPIAYIQENGQNHVSAIDFDYAGNLVTATAYGERVAIYAVPYESMDPVVTPAAKPFVVGADAMSEEMEDAIKALNANGSADAIYNIAGQRVQKAQNGIFIQNGKKVSVK